MTLIEVPRSEMAFQERGWQLEATLGTRLTFGADWFGRYDLFAFGDHVFTAVLHLGPFALSFTKLDRSKYED